MSDNVSNQNQGDCMDLFDWNGYDGDYAMFSADSLDPGASDLSYGDDQAKVDFGFDHNTNDWLVDPALDWDSIDFSTLDWSDDTGLRANCNAKQLPPYDMLPTVTTELPSSGAHSTNSDGIKISNHLYPLMGHSDHALLSNIECSNSVDCVKSQLSLRQEVSIDTEPSYSQPPGLESSNVSSTTSQNRPGAASQVFPCPHSNCTYGRPFTRNWELVRHIRTKHNGAKPFTCPFFGCFQKGTEPPAFARPDKLTSHIRNAHKRQYERELKCPVKGCTSEHLTMEVFSSHFHHQHLPNGSHPWSAEESWRAEESLGKGISNGCTFHRACCPIWSCDMTINLSSLPKHLLEHHSFSELERFDAELKSWHLIVTRPNDNAGDIAKDRDSDGIQAFVMIRVQCPICNSLYNCHSDIQVHIDTDHLIASEHSAHFTVWQHDAKGTKAKHPRLQATFNACRQWQDLSYRLKCSYCNSSPRHEVRSHHYDMLADPETIMPYRREILKVYPEFAEHPIWKDV